MIVDVLKKDKITNSASHTSAPLPPAPCTAVLEGRNCPRRAASTWAWFSGVKKRGRANHRRVLPPPSGRQWKQAVGAAAAAPAARTADA